jgi:hypothetical protein
MARLFTPLPLIVLLLTLAACGGEDTAGSEPTATSPPTASATPDGTASATATATATATASPSATPGGEDQPGGGGDEAEARVPVAVTVGPDGTVSPPTVAVPAFLALELQVRNRTGGAVTVTWNASEPAGSFRVAAGATSARRVAGVRKGSYPLAVEGAGTATVISGTEPGP